jgi:hypothetical protein
MKILEILKRISSDIKERREYKKQRRRANSSSRSNYYLHKSTKNLHIKTKIK